jgi:adenosylcobyric acid synthase
MLRFGGDIDGCISANGRVAGCYLHGLFAGDGFRRAFLANLGATPGDIAYDDQVEATLEALADHLERHLDLPALLAAARPPRLRQVA